MRTSWLLALTLLGGCTGASSGSPAPAPPQAPAEPLIPWSAVEAEECGRLVSGINSGLAQVEALANQTRAAGGNELRAVAAGLDALADAFEAQPFAVDDLLRLGGFYVGVLRLQAQTTRELDDAIARGDEAAASSARSKLATLGAQDDAIVGDINRRCEGALAASATPTGGPAPTPSGTAPAATSPAPAAPPAP